VVEAVRLESLWAHPSALSLSLPPSPPPQSPHTPVGGTPRLQVSPLKLE
jgi:hypothetical protein